jgi:hypothetical protein
MVVRQNGKAHHDPNHGVKLHEEWRVTPGFMGFLPTLNDFSKKKSIGWSFEHTCCITPHIASEAAAGSGALRG